MSRDASWSKPGNLHRRHIRMPVLDANEKTLRRRSHWPSVCSTSSAMTGTLMSQVPLDGDGYHQEQS